jgi:hypothetical protein
MPEFKDYMPGGSTIVNSSSETVSMIDHLSNSNTTIDERHRRVHRGNMFSNSHLMNMTGISTHNVTGLTPATGTIHFQISNFASVFGNVTVDFYEGSSPPVGSTPLSSYNRNRNSTAVATIVVSHDGTISALGTLLSKGYIPGSTGIAGTGAGGQVTDDTEWILKPSTYYTIQITNPSASNTINISYVWYEAGVN